MIVAFEGIDGAGKTTTAPLVAEALRLRGHSATSTTKRESIIEDPFAREQVEALAARLWGVPHDSRMNSVGTLHWVYLNAAFFTATHFALCEQLGQSEIVVMDNWINKFAARIIAAGELPYERVLEFLKTIPQPDIVVMLDVEPARAVSRKSAGASDAERGSLHGGRPDFAAYQGVVRNNLLSMAHRFGWVIVSPGAKSAAEVAEEVADIVEAGVANPAGAGRGPNGPASVNA